MAKKTLKLKKTSATTSAPPQQEAAAEGSAPVVASVASISGASVSGPSASYMASGIAGIIAVVLLGALLALQFMENSGYKGVIPVKPTAAAPAP